MEEMSLLYLMRQHVCEAMVIVHVFSMKIGAYNIDSGEPFVKATYRLEGDGPLVFTV